MGRTAQATGEATGMVVRDATASDVPAIAALYASLSQDSVHMRFSCSMSVEAFVAAAVLDADRDAHAVLATVGDRLVGEARYVRLRDGNYELGVTIVDDHQHQGLGRRLLDGLCNAAAQRGIPALRAVVRPDNVPMLRTLISMGSVVVQPVDDFEVVAEVATDGGMPGWPEGTSGRRVLVESSSLWEDPATGELRGAGFEVRQCLGPKRGPLQSCPLITSGRCRLVEGADVVACLLPDSNSNTHAVRADHAARRPDVLAAGSVSEWREAVRDLLPPG